VTPTTPQPVEGPYLDQGVGPPVLLVRASNRSPDLGTARATHRAACTRPRADATLLRHSPWPDDARDFSIGTHALSCDDLKRLGDTPVVVARENATRTFYNIAAEWAAACIPASTLVVVPNARHLLPVEDDTTFTKLILDLLA
jgi:pimeloyl-ACP methyl ester carboxylesterase